MTDFGKIHPGDFRMLEDSHLYAPRYTDFKRSKSAFWADAIVHLLSAGYSFHAERFSDGGCLFRGMETDLIDAIQTGVFGHFAGSREECRVEQIMDVYFLTRELSDAITVAGLKHSSRSGSIIVLAAGFFNRELDSGNAAVMAIGDSGMVFRYPFITRPIMTSDIAGLIVEESLADDVIAIRPGLRGKIITYPSGENTETVLQDRLQQFGIKPATTLPANSKPTLTDLA